MLARLPESAAIEEAGGVALDTMTGSANCLHLLTNRLAGLLSTCCRVALLLTCLDMVLVSDVSALTCVQCVSINAPSCFTGDLTPTPCVGVDSGSTYCLKSVGTQVVGNAHFVFRTCSKTLQTNCTLTFVEGDFYNICHDSCVVDGCNIASTTAVSWVTAGLMCLFHGL